MPRGRNQKYDIRLKEEKRAKIKMSEDDNDWINWEPIARVDKEDQLRQIDECKERKIPTKIVRIKYEGGSEKMAILKKVNPNPDV